MDGSAARSSRCCPSGRAVVSEVREREGGRRLTLLGSLDDCWLIVLVECLVDPTKVGHPNTIQRLIRRLQLGIYLTLAISFIPSFRRLGRTKTHR